MKQYLAVGLTLGLIGLVLFFANRRTEGPPSEEPEDVVWKLLDESKEGNIDGYLECFAGEMRTRLETTAADMTPDKFSAYLKESLEKVKGVAVFDVERSSDTTARLVVEYVYQDKNERQRLRLSFQESAWRIEEAEASEWIHPLIPYGQSVTEIE